MSGDAGLFDDFGHHQSQLYPVCRRCLECAQVLLAAELRRVQLRALEQGVAGFRDVNTVFIGWVTLALALAERQPIEQAIRFASVTAALKCTRFGGRLGIPTRAEVEAVLTTTGTNPAYAGS